MPLRASVVVVNWNGAHLLGRCLDALLEQTLPRDQYEVVVVDNGSTDGSPGLLSAYEPAVRTVHLPTNRGFAGGCNAGIRATDAPCVVLINNDAVAAPDFLERLLAALDENGSERVGAVTARIMLAGGYREATPEERSLSGGLVGHDGVTWVPAQATDPARRRLVNSTGNEVTTDGNGRDRDWLAVDGATQSPPDVFGLCGGAAALRRAALDDVGLFDEDFFLYYEDTDLSWRLRRAGWCVRYEQAAVVEHLHSASSGRGSALFRYYNERNRLALLTRHAPLLLVLRGLGRYLARTLVSARSPATVLPRLIVLRDWIRWLPGLWRSRRELDCRSPRSRGDVASWLVRPGPRRD